jgi:hypothetical protein
MDSLPVIADFLDAARHPDANVRQAAQAGLVRLGEWGIVVQALQDEAPSVRAAAASALGAVSTPPPAEVAAALEGALQDVDATVRRFALEALRLLHVRSFPAPPAQPPVLPPSADPQATPPRFPWGPFLVRWSWRLLQLPQRYFRLEVYQLPDAAFQLGWLGFPGATVAQLLAAEQRLGRPLPPSYRAFLQLTNGWPFGLTEPLLPIEEVELLQVKEPDMVRIWLEDQQEEPDLWEAAHRVYGEQQDTSWFRRAYLRTAVQISAQEDGYVYLLNPEVVTPDGEWEAWILGSKIAGAKRWPSFWELVQEESVTQFPGGSPSEAADGQGEPLPPEA